MIEALQAAKVANGMSLDDIAAISKMACGEICPDITIILDIDTRIGLERAKSRSTGEDRFEAKGRAYHEKVRTGYLEIAVNAPTRCVVINANRNPDEVAADIWQVLCPHLLTNDLIDHD